MLHKWKIKGQNLITDVAIKIKCENECKKSIHRIIFSSDRFLRFFCSVESYNQSHTFLFALGTHWPITDAQISQHYIMFFSFVQWFDGSTSAFDYITNHFSNCTSTFRILNSCISLAMCQTPDLTLYRQTLTRAVESSWRPFEETNEAMFKQVSVASRTSSYVQVMRWSNFINVPCEPGSERELISRSVFYSRGQFLLHLNNRLCCQILQLNLLQ